MNIINRSCFFFLITILTLSFFVKSQSNAETTLTNEGIKFPDGTLQTKKAVETETPVPQSPEIPERPERPENPEGGAGDTGLIGPQGPIR